MSYVKREKTEKVTLVSDPKYWVEIKTKLRWADMKEIANVTSNGSVTVQVDAMLLQIIDDWNLDDDEGNKLPINQTSLDELMREDIDLLVSKMGGFVQETEDQKKAS